MIVLPSGPGRRFDDFLGRGSRALLCLLFSALFCGSASTQGLTYSGGAVDVGAGLVGQTVNAGEIRITTATGATVITGVMFTSDGAVSQEFASSANSCTGTVAGPGSCNISLNFTPRQTGLRRGAVTITSTGNAPLILYLHGIGQGSQLVFSPDAASAISTVTPLSPIYYSPTGSVYDGAGNLFFNDVLNNRILEQSAAGTLSTVFSLPGSIMSSIAISPTGMLFVSVPSQSTVYAVIPGGSSAPITFSGLSLSQPSGLAVDGSGNLYVADAQSNRIVRSAFDGSNAIVLPLTGLSPALSAPEGLTVDVAGNLYIVDTGRQRIVKVALATGAAAPIAISGGFIYNSYGVTTEASGALYVADTGNRRILRISPSGAASAVLTPGFAFSTPSGVTLAANGDLIVADNNVGLTRIGRSTPSSPLTFNTPTPVGMLDSSDGSKIVSLQNIGTTALALTVPAGSATNPSSTSSAFQLASAGSTCPILTSASTGGALAAGASCDYAVSFTPTVIGANSGSLLISQRPAGSATSSSQTFPLSGTGLTTLDSLNIFTNLPATLTGTPITFTVSAVAGGSLSTGYTGTVSFTSTDPAVTFLSGTSYTFTAADAGVHVFTAPAGGVKFGSVGTFILSAKDGAVSASSNAVVVKTSQIASMTALTAAPSPVFLFNPVTLTATVTSALATVATGTVTFFDGSVPIGSAALSAGKATLTANFSTVAAHTLTAMYAGDANFLPSSASPPATVQVVDFTIAPATTSGTSAAVLPGNPATYTFVVTPQGSTTFPAPVTFTLSGLPAGATYTILPVSIPAGSTASSHLLTINVPKLAAMRVPPVHPFLRDAERVSPIALALLLPFLRRQGRRRGRRLASLLLLFAALSVTLGLTGCLSDQASGYFGQVPKTYTVTITAASGGLSHSTNFILNVQ